MKSVLIILGVSCFSKVYVYFCFVYFIFIQLPSLTEQCRVMFILYYIVLIQYGSDQARDLVFKNCRYRLYFTLIYLMGIHHNLVFIFVCQSYIVIICILNFIKSYRFSVFVCNKLVIYSYVVTTLLITIVKLVLKIDSVVNP